MSTIVNSAAKVLGTLASIALHPITPACSLILIKFGPPGLLDRCLSLELVHRLLRPRSFKSIQLSLQLLLALGLVRSLNRAASTWALNNWRVSSQPGWRWEGEVAVVTGGCSGIGKAIVLGLAKKGVTVAVLDIQDFPEDLEKIESVKYWKCDITSPSEVRNAAGGIRKSVGHPSILINNAGIAFVAPILKTDEDSLRNIFGVNVMSLWSTVQEFLPNMILKNKGHVVTVASVASYSTLPTAVPYSATKSGALAFHEGLKTEIKHMYKAPGILTTVAHPMWVSTNMTAKYADSIEKTSGKMMGPEAVSERVLEQLFSCRGGHLVIPENMSWLSAVRSFPSWMQEVLRDAVGSKLRSQ